MTVSTVSLTHCFRPRHPDRIEQGVSDVVEARISDGATHATSACLVVSVNGTPRGRVELRGSVATPGGRSEGSYNVLAARDLDGTPGIFADWATSCPRWLWVSIPEGIVGLVDAEQAWVAVRLQS